MASSTPNLPSVANRIVFVAGATGLTGRLIVKQLIERNFIVRALVRNEAAALKVLPKSDLLKLVVADVQNKTALIEAIRGTAGVISALGSSSAFFGENTPYHVDYLGVANLVEASKAAGVLHFVLISSTSVTKTVSFLNLLGRMGTWKLRGEQALRESGLRYIIIRPATLTNSEEQKPIVVGQGDQLGWGYVSRRTVATSAVAGLAALWVGSSSMKGEGVHRLTFEMKEGEGYDPRSDQDWFKIFTDLKSD